MPARRLAQRCCVWLRCRDGFLAEAEHARRNSEPGTRASIGCSAEARYPAPRCCVWLRSPHACSSAAPQHGRGASDSGTRAWNNCSVPARYPAPRCRARLRYPHACLFAAPQHGTGASESGARAWNNCSALARYPAPRCCARPRYPHACSFAAPKHGTGASESGARALQSPPVAVASSDSGAHPPRRSAPLVRLGCSAWRAAEPQQKAACATTVRLLPTAPAPTSSTCLPLLQVLDRWSPGSAEAGIAASKSNLLRRFARCSQAPTRMRTPG